MAIKFNPIIFEGLDLTGSAPVGIGVVVPGSVGNSILTTDVDGKMDEKILNDGQLLIGDTGGEPVVASLTGTANQVTVTPGAGSIQLSLPQNIDTNATVTFDKAILDSSSNQLDLSTGVNRLTLNSGTSAAARTYTVPDVGAAANFVLTEGNQTLNGTKTFSQKAIFPAATGVQVDTRADIANVIINNSSVDVVPTGGTDVLNLGALTADVVNIGNPGSTVNIQGIVNNISSTNLNVTDSLITINDGGPVASGGGAGIEVEENNVATAHLKVSAGRDAWSVKAPTATGTIELQPPSSGTFTINQALFEGKANTALDNLTTTSINQNLIPNADNSRNIGTSSARWATLNAINLDSGASNLRLGNSTGNLIFDGNALRPQAGNINIGDSSFPFANVITNSMGSPAGNALSVTSGTGTINFNSNFLGSISDPTSAQQAATKNYVDTSISNTSSSVETLTNKTIDADLNTITNIENADIKVGAAIARNKLASGTINHVIINDGTGVLSSEAALAASRGGLGTSGAAFTGVVKAATGVFSASTIVNADVSGTAAIAYSKLALSNSIVNADIATAAAVARTKLANGTINHVLINDGTGVMSSEAALAASRGGLGTSGAAFTGVVKAATGVFSASTIVDADVSASAAITRTKIANGTINHVLINSGTGAISSEAALAASRGGLGTSAAAFTGVVKAATGVFSAATIVDADVSASAAIARTKLANGTANRLVVNGVGGAMADAAAITAARALISDANGIPTQSTVTSTELGFLSGVTSAIQTQLTNAANSTLSNLGVTAINNSLNPATANSITVGTASLPIFRTSTTNLETNVIATLSGTSINVSGNTIGNLSTPTLANEATTKAYVDNLAASITSSLALTGGATISLSATSLNQTIVVGAASAVTLSITPFTATAPLDGTLVTLIGNSNTNTITISNNDAAKGCVLNGNATLGLYDALVLRYVASLDRYVEMSRS